MKADTKAKVRELIARVRDEVFKRDGWAAGCLTEALALLDAEPEESAEVLKCGRTLSGTTGRRGDRWTPCASAPRRPRPG